MGAKVLSNTFQDYAIIENVSQFSKGLRLLKVNHPAPEKKGVYLLPNAILSCAQIDPVLVAGDSVVFDTAPVAGGEAYPRITRIGFPLTL